MIRKIWLSLPLSLKILNVSLNYDNLRFDIYEDINNGVVLAVPEGKS